MKQNFQSQHFYIDSFKEYVVWFKKQSSFFGNSMHDHFHGKRKESQIFRKDKIKNKWKAKKYEVYQVGASDNYFEVYLKISHVGEPSNYEKENYKYPYLSSKWYVEDFKQTMDWLFKHANNFGLDIYTLVQKEWKNSGFATNMYDVTKDFRVSDGILQYEIKVVVKISNNRVL